MDESTRRYYSGIDRTSADRYESVGHGISRYFARAFGPDDRVLDLGCGTGRDTATLVKEGRPAYGLEPVSRMRELAVHYHPELADRIFAGELPDHLPDIEAMGGPFEGVVCSAVLQHLPRHQLFDAVYAIRQILRERGRLLVSVPDVTAPDGGGDRDESGRLFNGVPASELNLLFARGGFLNIGKWVTDDSLGRSDRRWVTLLFELHTASASRPLDRIEAILRRDRKVATYKLALLRALADIALTRPRAAMWRADGYVGIPIANIAELWVRYYWPFFEQPPERFMPQMSGDWKGRAFKAKFAGHMHEVVTHYSDAGGLARYLVDRKTPSRDGRGQRLTHQLLNDLKATIREGPVKHAGVSTSPEGKGVFDYDPGIVLVPEELWMELSLMGHWIRDSLILRWAEMSASLSSHNVRTEDVVTLLLSNPDDERDTAIVRAIYKGRPGLQCVWTGTRIRRDTLEVDHVIPYTLWRNNDLWNLLPATRTANQAKLDKLPTRTLLHDRRDAILTFWEVNRAAHSRRFEHEAMAMVGHDEPKLDELFDVLTESVEVTALRQGCERWDPRL